jgi:hypothetical protein
MVDMEEEDHGRVGVALGRSLDQGTKWSRPLLDRFSIQFAGRDCLGVWRLALVGVAWWQTSLSLSGRATELGVRLRVSIGTIMRLCAPTAFVGVIGCWIFIADNPGDVGGVEDKPGVVKGLLTGVYMALDEDLPLLTSLAVRLNHSRISATGVLGLVTVPILSTVVGRAWQDILESSSASPTFAAFASERVLPAVGAVSGSPILARLERLFRVTVELRVRVVIAYVVGAPDCRFLCGFGQGVSIVSELECECPRSSS